jgi:hypothetical protein
MPASLDISKRKEADDSNSTWVLPLRLLDQAAIEKFNEYQALSKFPLYEAIGGDDDHDFEDNLCLFAGWLLIQVNTKTSRVYTPGTVKTYTSHLKNGLQRCNPDAKAWKTENEWFTRLNKSIIDFGK